jgi:SAM-dependent methyltransferase
MIVRSGSATPALGQKCVAGPTALLPVFPDPHDLLLQPLIPLLAARRLPLALLRRVICRGREFQDRARARAGDWSVVLVGYQPVPRDWFPARLAGLAVLCLASGGGQQGPVLAAVGASVTVFDNSPRQLGRDEQVAVREGLSIRTVLGDMRDLSAFPGASFDVIVHPVSNVFCPDVAPVWREALRVLRPGGVLLAGFLNPDLFIFDAATLEQGELVVRHTLPFSTLDLPDAERLQYYGNGPVEYSHSLTEQIGGQLVAGFVLTHLVEAPHHADAAGQYMPGYIATRAIKPS